MVINYTFTLEYAPIKLGPWRHIEAIHGDNYITLMYDAMKKGLAQPYPWVRIVPDGKVQRSVLIRRGDK